jgi:hypothetical protein
VTAATNSDKCYLRSYSHLCEKGLLGNHADSITSQHYNEIIKITNLKQSDIQKQTLEVNRLAIEYDRKIFRQCLLDGEQQANCFTLAILIAVLIGLIMTLW